MSVGSVGIESFKDARAFTMRAGLVGAAFIIVISAGMFRSGICGSYWLWRGEGGGKKASRRFAAFPKLRPGKKQQNPALHTGRDLVVPCKSFPEFT